MTKPTTNARRDEGAEGRRLWAERFARHRAVIDATITPEDTRKVWAAIAAKAAAGHPEAKKLLARYRPVFERPNTWKREEYKTKLSM